MKIIIPMLGRGSKFIQAGIKVPKPLIVVKGKYMFEWALESIDFLNIKKDSIFIILKQHIDQGGLDEKIKEVVGNKVNLEIVDFIPEGAAKTVLLARSHIDNSEELVIYNMDQFFRAKSLQNYFKKKDRPYDGIIPTFHATHPKWSYVETNSSGYVTRTAEKEVISNVATVGFYYFKKGSDFVAAADSMVEKKIMINGEYYVCPTYNELIAKGKKIRSMPVDEMWSMATPEDVAKFQKYYKESL